ncbi:MULTISPECIES: Rv2175c family DNA-binding protein [unclassified Microcella]|uniref:Rv2175c family DNA-binding protein n=1 Tax=unclassified Microcella TaxID=2630066 RepID=UPI0006F7C68A|nr:MULTISPECIES: Rv2175c family DNA-binding protein [unclassified Microcella]KQV25153.1 transcriptional regulator [Yonghaparkia sp. Root332]KRF31435.1 transcriptional regulator [Yonghaparkia sp. Soil809]
MTADSSRWLTVPDLVELLGVSPGRVHRLLEDHALLAVRRDRVLVVPEEFLRDGEPLHELRGTLILLADNGFSDDEAMEWMLSVDEMLGTSPIEALRRGRKAEVRRVAQAMAF